MSDHGYSMPCYFQNMPVVGAPLRAVNAENEAELKKIEEHIALSASVTQQAVRREGKCRGLISRRTSSA